MVSPWGIPRRVAGRLYDVAVGAVSQRLVEQKRAIAQQGHKIQTQRTEIAQLRDQLTTWSHTEQALIADIALLRDQVAKLALSQADYGTQVLSTGLRFINKTQVDLEISLATESGVTAHPHHPRLIVSLTSFPARIYEAHFAIHSLLSQTLKPDKVILWLAADQFPRRFDDLPPAILTLQQRGLTIEFTTNINSYKKLIPALTQYPDDIIITADDDIYYHRDWLRELVECWHQTGNRHSIIAHLTREPMVTWQSSDRGFDGDGDNDCDNDGDGDTVDNAVLGETLDNYQYWPYRVGGTAQLGLMPLTGAGALFPPHSLDPQALTVELFRQLAPTADDLWVWIMALKHGTPIKPVPVPSEAKLLSSTGLTVVDAARELGLGNQPTLWRHNKDQNDQVISALLNYFPEAAEKILELSDTPRVTVLLDARDATLAQFERTWNSILSQRHTNPEFVILVSQDDSGLMAELNSIAERSVGTNSFSVIPTTQLNARYPEVLATSKGLYLTLIKAGDTLSENYLSGLYLVARRNDADVACAVVQPEPPAHSNQAIWDAVTNSQLLPFAQVAGFQQGLFIRRTLAEESFSAHPLPDTPESSLTTQLQSCIGAATRIVPVSNAIYRRNDK